MLIIRTTSGFRLKAMHHSSAPPLLEKKVNSPFCLQLTLGIVPSSRITLKA